MPKEIAYLLETRRPFRGFLEIGAAAGGGGRVLDDFLHFQNIVVVDDDRNPLSFQRQFILPHCVNICLDSQSTGCRVALEELGLSFDLVMIDGDHSCEAVRTIRRWRLRCAARTRYPLPDTYCCPGVMQWVEELDRGVVPGVKLFAAIGGTRGIWAFEQFGGMKTLSSGAGGLEYDHVGGNRSEASSARQDRSLQGPNRSLERCSSTESLGLPQSAADELERRLERS